MYGTISNNKATSSSLHDAEVAQQDRTNSNNYDNNNNIKNTNNQSGYTRLVTFMVVVLSLLGVVTLSAGVYVGSSSSSMSNSGGSVDTSITTTITGTTTISSVKPDDTGIINTITATEYTNNPTPTALYPTESPIEEIDLNTAMNVVKDIKTKKEVKESQNKGKIIENSLERN